jgi:hypothetical protein
LDSNAPDGVYYCSRILVSAPVWNAISCWAGTWNFDHCTVAHCAVPNWGDGFATGTCTVNIKNSISVFNSECGVACWGSGPTTVSYSNVYGNVTLQAAYDPPNNLRDYYPAFDGVVMIDGGGNISADPQFVGSDPNPAHYPMMSNPQYWPWMTTAAYDLLPTSPCIGAADDGSDLGAIQYGTHNIAGKKNATYTLLRGWNWFTVPVAPFNQNMASVLPGAVSNLSAWSNLQRTTLTYGTDFLYWTPGQAYVVWLNNPLTISIPAVPIRASSIVPVYSAGRLDLGVPFDTAVPLSDVRLRKYSNSAAAGAPPVWTLVQERSMSDDYNGVLGPSWFNWQLVYWDASLATVVVPNVTPSFVLEPWVGYRLWVQAAAIAAPDDLGGGQYWLHEKIDLFFRNPSYGAN